MDNVAWTASAGHVTRAAAVVAGVPTRSGLLKRMRELLGVGTLRTERDLVALVEERLATSAIDTLRQAGLTDDEVYAILIPRRTLAHRLARREPLSRDESDRVVRMARIAGPGEEVFGDPSRSWRWLRAAKRQFDGRSPLDLLTTEAGTRLVEELLYRIDDGMAA